MSIHDASPLGRCPRCTATITAGSLLIEYETETGDPGAFAECPECEDVVTPV